MPDLLCRQHDRATVALCISSRPRSCCTQNATNSLNSSFAGLLAFNVVFVLFLIAPAALALDLFLPLKPAKLGTQAKPSEGTLGSLLRLRVLAAVVAPPVLWLATLRQDPRLTYRYHKHLATRL